MFLSLLSATVILFAVLRFADCVQVAVKRTLAAGKGSGVRHLNNFTAAGGKPVADPEDDKLWLSLESKHTLLEFDFARTWQQVCPPSTDTCWSQGYI